MQRIRRVGAAMGLLALTLTTGCPFFVYPGSLNGGSSATTGYVYVANATAATLSGYAVGTATLTAVTNSPYALSFVPTAVAVNPADTIVFVAGDSQIFAYAIESGGALSALNNGSAVGLANTVAMYISPDGQWLFALDGNDETLDEFLINSSTGQLTNETQTNYTSLVSGTIFPRDVKVAPNGAYVFVALGTAGDLVYTFNTASTSGALSSPQYVAPLTSSTSDNALAVSPNSSTLFIARSYGQSDGSITSYSIGTGGALSLPVTVATTGVQPFSAVVNAAGTNVFVANRSDSTISGYSLASTGTLTSLGSPTSSGPSVTALAVDKSGDYLLALANGGSPDLTMYSFSSTGSLGLSTTTTTGADPTGPVALAATH
jgi:6-phosphogluconolactonase